MDRRKSEVQRERNRQNGIKAIKRLSRYHITKSQRKLSEALTEKGIKNIMEFYIPEIRRLVDIIIPSIKLAIEVDGIFHRIDFWGKTKEQKKEDDIRKNNQLNYLGWRILRFDNEEIDNDVEGAVDFITGCQF